MAKKLTKTALTKFFKEYNISLSREERGDFNLLWNKVETLNMIPTLEEYFGEKRVKVPETETKQEQESETEQESKQAPETEQEQESKPEPDTKQEQESETEQEQESKQAPETEQEQESKPNPEPDITDRLKNARVKQPIQPPEYQGVIQVNNEPKQKKTRRNSKKVDPSFINGYILLMVIDMTLPTGLSMVYKLFIKDKSKHFDPDELMLDDDQRNKLEPLAEAAAQHLQLNINPVYTFLIVSIVMYSSNMMQLQAGRRLN